MRQRVALARALVLRPDILLLDEPFSALDVVTRFRLEDELLRFWQMNGWTVIFATHNLDEAAYLADRVAVLNMPPQGLSEVFTIAAPRPRTRQAPELREYSHKLEQALAVSVRY